MRILRFNDFLLEDLAGGGGVTFTGSCTLSASYEVSSNMLRLGKKAMTTVEKFSATGFGDTFAGLAPWLLEVDAADVREIKGEALKKIKIAGCSGQVCNALDIEDGDFATIGELLKIHPDITIKVRVSGGYNYEDVRFKGYLKGSFSEGDPVMEKVSNMEKYSAVFVEGITADGNDMFIKSLAPRLLAGQRFEDFFEQAFNDKDKHDFISDEVVSRVKSGELDSELSQFIEKSPERAGQVPDKLKRDFVSDSKDLDDFITFITDKEVMSSIEKSWVDSVTQEYTADHDPTIS